MDNLRKSIRIVGTCFQTSIKFISDFNCWHDVWIREATLETSSKLNLLLVAFDKDTSVASNMEMLGLFIVYPWFCKSNTWLEARICSFLVFSLYLYSAQVAVSDDRMCRQPTKNGKFEVCFYHEALQGTTSYHVSWNNIWCAAANSYFFV
jgi:hypothetical protein